MQGSPVDIGGYYFPDDELIDRGHAPEPDLQRRPRRDLEFASARRPAPKTQAEGPDVLLAELNVRHTRRHMPTRRVALDDGYLPTSGPAFGGVLIGAVVAEHVAGLDEEQFDALDRLVDDARDGLSVPRIALRYRLQTDTHGLDLSRHRIIERRRSSTARCGRVLELDLHGPPRRRR